MPERRPEIPKLFISNFTVDYESPFKRHLNRLEVEIGREDYRHLKRVELLDEHPTAAQFAAMEEITGRLLKTTQNNYNRDLLQKLGIRVYLDAPHYSVYYRLPDRVLRFVASWREHTLGRFFGKVPTSETGWHRCMSPADFEARFLPDPAGGVLLLRRAGERDPALPLLTASHGPYDPHTLDVALFFLRAGKGDAAMINLGFSGREPLTDENLAKLKGWGVPLNPSNIDVIYPYVNAKGHPLCYKLEEGFGRYLRILGGPAPELVIDIHGCVGTRSDDYRLIVGLGGLPPYPTLASLGEVQENGGIIHLRPDPRLRRGLAMLRDLSEEIYVQFCSAPHQGYQFALLGGLQMLGRTFDPHQETKSLLAGEERTFLPAEDLRWLPGAGANAHQRIEARRLNPQARCLHVEIPTAVRRRIALKMRELAITDSLDASVL
ncbi:hypothetical protein [Trichloromonas sp.]|uniref:hypothetical protein n=1 Tax=Trichloromonas sp. TaxID=3069249 RepID=UPI003D81AEFE